MLVVASIDVHICHAATLCRLQDITSDESFETRRKNTLERLKFRTMHEIKVAEFSMNEVLATDGVKDFSLEDGYLNARAIGSSNNDG